jgi:hypothetical protein
VKVVENVGTGEWMRTSGKGAGGGEGGAVCARHHMLGNDNEKEMTPPRALSPSPPCLPKPCTIRQLEYDERIGAGQVIEVIGCRAKSMLVASVRSYGMYGCGVSDERSYLCVVALGTMEK